jgi:GNAT superfamily N-acetyltransferase
MSATSTQIDVLPPAAAADATTLERLLKLINRVYAVSEEGLWRDATPRVSADELAELVRTGQIAVASRDGAVVGSIRFHDVAPGTAEFGVLVSDPEHRGTGVGRGLVEFAEHAARERGLTSMQLELLVPHTGTHPSKKFLADWYGRVGYRVIATRRFADAYPHLAPMLAVPCDLLVYEKRL